MLLLDTIILIEVLVGCREDETIRMQSWLESFPRLPLADAIVCETGRLRHQHGLRIPDAIIRATARCGDLILATGKVKDFLLELGGVLPPCRLEADR